MHHLLILLGWLLSAPLRADPGQLDRVLAAKSCGCASGPTTAAFPVATPKTQHLTDLDVDVAQALAKDP